ncbi:MAG: hypothetical protein LUC48_02640, partial [Clostridiales bacterium]|nr:hypothetical protein [Clostridiales bacterium]
MIVSTSPWANFCSYVFCWGFCLVFMFPLPRRRGFLLLAGGMLLLSCAGYALTEEVLPEGVRGLSMLLCQLAIAFVMVKVCCKVK